MRDEGRIDIICDKLKQYWHYVPDWRFLQLTNNLAGYISNGDGFYVEDDVFESKLDELLLMEDESNGEVDDQDWCYECTWDGDDYSTDDDGNLVSICDDCIHNSYSIDEDD